MRLVVRTAAFQRRVSRLRSGNTTKARIRPAQFEHCTSRCRCCKQNALIATYTGRWPRHETGAGSEVVERTRAGRRLKLALGVALPVPLPDRPMFVARFQDVERWSHEGVLRSLTQTPTAAACQRFHFQRGKVSYGIQKSPANRPGTHARPYLRVANVQRGVLDLREIKFINVPDEEMPKLRLEVGDVLL